MRALTALLLATALLLPLGASAQRGPGGGPGRGPEAEGRRAEAERRLRTMRAVSLANYLDLDEAKAVELNGIMQRYDAERDVIRAELQGYVRVLRTAANSEQVDEAAVEQAIEGALSARARLEGLARQEAQELMKGLDAKRKARLMLFFKEFPKRVRRMMRGMDPDAPGHGRRGARGMGPRGEGPRGESPSAPAPGQP